MTRRLVIYIIKVNIWRGKKGTGEQRKSREDKREENGERVDGKGTKRDET